MSTKQKRHTKTQSTTDQTITDRLEEVVSDIAESGVAMVAMGAASLITAAHLTEGKERRAIVAPAPVYVVAEEHAPQPPNVTIHENSAAHQRMEEIRHEQHIMGMHMRTHPSSGSA